MTKLEIFFAASELIISFITLILIILGWIIPYKQSTSLEKIKWEKEFIDRQISELYGPLDASLKNAELIRSNVFKQLGRNHVFIGSQSFSQLPIEEQNLWKHYVENYKIPYLMEEVKLIQNNYHLIDSSSNMENYQKFIDYALGWEFLNNQYENGVENNYNYHYITNYPYEFSEDVQNVLKKLKKRSVQLIEKIEEYKK